MGMGKLRDSDTLLRKSSDLEFWVSLGWRLGSLVTGWLASSLLLAEMTDGGTRSPGLSDLGLRDRITER